MKTAVVALGGNAITGQGDEGTIPEQFDRTTVSLAGVVELANQGYNLVVTHGNGPQVGNALLRVELTRECVYPLPLAIIDADIQGGMGYMIQQCLARRLSQEGIGRQVVTVVTQVVIDNNDPSLTDPTKPIGPFYDEDEVAELLDRGWVVKEDAGRGYRRLVPSPTPLEIVERETIKLLVDHGVIVIAAGGGGVPVIRGEDGVLTGVDGVIDKDRVSAILARDIGAEMLLFLTDVERVALHYGTKKQHDLDSMTLDEARRYLAEGHFPAGSMGPKIEAAIEFLEDGGGVAIVTSIEQASQAVLGSAGTRICVDARTA
jgi:carbamate kinase